MNLWLVILGFLVSYLANITGAGYGTLLSPILVILGFDIKAIVPSIVASQLIANTLLSILHHRHGNTDLSRNGGDLKLVAPLAVASAVGAMISVSLLIGIPRRIAEYYLGLMLAILGVIILKTRSSNKSSINEGNFNIKLAILSLIASINKGVTGGGLSPVLSVGQVLIGIDPKKAVSLTPLAVITSEIVMVASYIYTGLFTGSIDILVPLTIGALLAVPLIPYRVKRSSNNFIRTVMASTLIALGVAVLVI
ncbi:MAG: sulfite exporter TauE/SafE family protein [Desulfurococcales archaeon]|nr:sulfite exporter TauE/SafE family protein [Desulfurococcales archaeon]